MPKEAESTKVACAVGVAALTAKFVKKLGPGGIKNVVREEPVGARQKSIGSTAVNLREGAPEKQDIETRCQRENDPRPKHHGTRGHEPAVSDPGVRVHEPASVNCSLTGSRPRLCALRADQTSSPTPWNAVEFDQPPRAANEDLWVQMNGGWLADSVSSCSSDLPCEDKRPGTWQNQCDMVEQCPWLEGGRKCRPRFTVPVQGRWRGWTFFRLKESVQVGASSSEVPRLHPDVIQWNPPEQEQPWRPPAQAGASTSSQRRGQVTATERGRLALGVVRAEAHAGPLTSRGSAPSVTSEGSWSVAGSANVKGSMASNAGIPKDDHIDADGVVARATAMAGRSTSPCTSSSASREVNQKGGYSVGPMLPTLEEPFVNSAFPKGSTILMRPKPRPSRWADGSIRFPSERVKQLALRC